MQSVSHITIHARGR